MWVIENKTLHKMNTKQFFYTTIKKSKVNSYKLMKMNNFQRETYDILCHFEILHSLINY